MHSNSVPKSRPRTLVDSVNKGVGCKQGNESHHGAAKGLTTTHFPLLPCFFPTGHQVARPSGRVAGSLLRPPSTAGLNRSQFIGKVIGRRRAVEVVPRPHRMRLLAFRTARGREFLAARAALGMGEKGIEASAAAIALPVRPHERMRLARGARRIAMTRRLL
jgi:hypothetical protein